MRYIVTEINMEKKSPSIGMLTIIVVVATLAIPMFPGITAAENNNSINKEVQWCCSYIEEEDNDSQDLLILNSIPKSNLVI
jgi:hypothetical protein